MSVIINGKEQHYPSKEEELDAAMLAAGWEQVLIRFEKLFPKIDITVSFDNEDLAKARAQAAKHTA